MSKLLRILAAVAAGLLVLACNKTEEEAQLSVSQTSINFEPSGTLEMSVKITCNVAWSITSNADWLTISPTSGNGSGTLTVKVQENPSVAQRSTDVKITAGSKSASLKVTQLGLTPELSVTPDKASFQADGGEVLFTVTSNTEWAATLADNAKDWLTLELVDGGFELTAAENKGLEARSSEVKVTADEKIVTIPVSQFGLEPALAVSPETLDEFPVEGGEAVVSVTANVSWTASAGDADWVEINVAQDNFKVVVAANPLFEVRTATVTVSGEGGVSKEIALSQAALTPFLGYSPEKLNPFDNAGGTQSLTVAANTDWVISIPEDASWLKADILEGSGEATVTLSAEANLTELSGRGTSIVLSLKNFDNFSFSLAVEQLPANYSRVTDSLALVAVFNATGGADNWHADRVWDLSKPMDEWYNVKLNEDGRVIQMNLAKGTVTADWSLPAEVGNLTEMTNFRIIGSNLTGAIPEEIYNMTKLVSFYLTNNTPTWSLSPKIADMTNLKDLYIDQNPNLTGELPKELGTLTNLVNINVSQTGISGAIPAELSGCSSLNNLMAYKTAVSSIPDNFDQWPALKLIQLYANPNLTGPLPASVGNCANLTSVWFYECNFEGNIPESWAGLPSTCNQLRIQDNKLSGVVSEAIQAHANWEKWNPAKYIFPQQEGYGLSDKSGSGGQDLDDTTDTDPWN